LSLPVTLQPAGPSISLRKAGQPVYHLPTRRWWGPSRPLLGRWLAGACSLTLGTTVRFTRRHTWLFYKVTKLSGERTRQGEENTLFPKLGGGRGEQLLTDLRVLPPIYLRDVKFNEENTRYNPISLM